MRPCVMPENKLQALQEVCSQEPRLIAVYLFGSHDDGECDLAALFTEVLPWADRVDLEVRLAQALGQETLELLDLRHAPLVVRRGIVTQGNLLYVGWPDPLASFVESVVEQYDGFEPLLKALYWQSSPTDAFPAVTTGGGT